jgi:hypothetical protein
LLGGKSDTLTSLARRIAFVMELREEIKNELKIILEQDLPRESFEQLTEEEIEDIGSMLLLLTSIVIRRT